MDVYLAIASKRDQRHYAETPVPADVARRILDAGRLSGNSSNKQVWEFVVVGDAARVPLAEAVYAPGNVRGAQFVVAICGDVRPIDVGRALQNMMLCAWEQGVTSCPNGIRDSEAAERVCGAEVRMVISFGYPAPPRRADEHTAEEWSARINRKPLDELVRHI